MMTDIAKPVLLCSNWFISLNNVNISPLIFSVFCECSDIKFPDMTKIQE